MKRPRNQTGLEACLTERDQKRDPECHADQTNCAKLPITQADQPAERVLPCLGCKQREQAFDDEQQPEG